ncbi:hypothetical protein Tco_0544230 [Tanacetum coccineum]
MISILVTPRVSALAGCDRLVSEPLVIENTQKNKVEAHPRKVKSSLKNKDCVVKPKGTAHIQNFTLNANSELIYVKCNGCMLSDNHDLCVLDFINNVNARTNSKSETNALDNETSKPVVTLVYSRKPRKSKTNVPVSKSKVSDVPTFHLLDEWQGVMPFVRFGYLDSAFLQHMTRRNGSLLGVEKVNSFPYCEE